MESDTVTEITSDDASQSASEPPAIDRTSHTDIIEAPKFEQHRPAPPPPARRLATGLGIVVFSTVKTLTEHRPGVLVTDVSDDRATIQAMTARLKEHLPELVTIAVSQHRDVLDMVWLINHGQIFRFLRKPLSAGRCAISLQAALQHHRMLLKNPDLVKRHEVEASTDSGLMDGVLAKLKNMKRLWV